MPQKNFIAIDIDCDLAQNNALGVIMGKFKSVGKTIHWCHSLTVILLIVSLLLGASCVPPESGSPPTPVPPPSTPVPPPPTPVPPPPTPVPPPPTFEEMQAEKISRAIDPQNPTTRNFAVQLAALFPGEYNIEQIESIYHYLYANWRYVSDPRGVNYYASASESINNGLAGDCDDFAVTIAALIEAIGGGSRVLLAYGSKDAHAYAEVLIGEDHLEYLAGKYQEVIWSRHDDQGGVWLNLDWSARHPGGPYFERERLIIVYPNGQWEKYFTPKT